ncbi:MAG: hypothetical protein MRJ96_06685 [Nitrospirales bacterium]|nr:hypothetical protein [Nitrospira sp.]MDR4501120.1 hypothetical protein [Nitrospirales bacterium]
MRWLIVIILECHLLLAGTAFAVPINSSLTDQDLQPSAESSPAHHFREITQTSPPPPTASPEGFVHNVFPKTSFSALFSTILSSLTYEIRFTALGRPYTATPDPLETTDHPLFSFRLLPHPEKLQSTALLNNNNLIDQKKEEPAPASQGSDFWTNLLWLMIASLALLGSIGWIMWKSRKKIVLDI